jgi:ABC-type polysaccharide/polyol phosphate export permease
MLLNKMRVPSIVFPVSTVIANSFQLVCGTLPALLIIAVFVGHNLVWMAFIVFPLFALVCLTLGISLALSALYVYYRDIPYLYELAYFAIFVATPVFYPLDIIDPKYRPIIEYNPLSLIVEQIRSIAVRDGAPSVLKLGVAVSAGLGILGLGTLLFNRASRRFMDYL